MNESNKVYLAIDASDGTPIYRQLKEQIRTQIAMGRLKPGDTLPSVRHLALELRVNHLTILKAYRELELEGILEKRRGQGTYVAEQNLTLAQEERQRMVHQLMTKAIVEGINLEMNAEEIRTIFDEALTGILSGPSDRIRELLEAYMPGVSEE